MAEADASSDGCCAASELGGTQPADALFEALTEATDVFISYRIQYFIVKTRAGRAMNRAATARYL